MSLLSGIEVYNLIDIKIGSKREEIILDLVLNNKVSMPEIMRFKPIIVNDNKGNSLEYYVSSDVFSLGTNDDYLRLPLFPGTAQKIATHNNCILPTSKMADDIWKQSEIKLNPRPIAPKPGEPSRESSITYKKHNRMIEEQLKEKDKSLLISGHKKDIVLYQKLDKINNKVCIYGWHYTDGKPIQPRSLAHNSYYVDYSHSLRLVQKMCKLNNKEMNIEDILKSVEYHHLVSNEGKYIKTSY